MFTNLEIKDKWMSSILDNQSRMKRMLPLENLPGTFSLFGKIEKGTTTKIIPTFLCRYKNNSKIIINNINPTFLCRYKLGPSRKTSS